MKTIGSIGVQIGYSTLLCVCVFWPTLSSAQISAPGFVSKPMQVSPISGVEDKEVAFINVTMEPGAASPRHTHPGDCYGAVFEGSVELLVDGQDAKHIEMWTSLAQSTRTRSLF